MKDPKSFDAAFRARAAARASWPMRRFRLGEEPGDDLRASTTAAERIEMMWPLVVDSWALARREMPDYSRSETPLRAVASPVGRRPGEGEQS